MDVLMNVVIAVGFVLLGYLVGSIPTGVIIGKAFFKVDPREYGSHGSGGTNSSRVLGKKVGVIVITLDIIKTIAVFWTCWAILNYSGVKNAFALWDQGVLYLWLSLLGAAIGHCFPLYIGFKGGKAVACFMGTTGGASWLMFILDFAVFFSVYKIGKKKNIVSFASIISSGILLLVVWVFAILSLCGISTSLFAWDFGLTGTLWMGWEEALITTLVYALLVFRHHENICRLRNGTEKQYNLFGK